MPRARTYFYNCLGARAGARAQMTSSTISSALSNVKYKQRLTDNIYIYICMSFVFRSDLPVVENRTDGACRITIEVMVLNIL